MRRISLLLLFTFLTVSFLQAQDEGTAADASAEAPVEQEASAEAVEAAEEVAPAETAKAPGSRLFQKICSFFHPLFR